MAWKRLIVSLAIPFAAAGIGSWFTQSSVDSWYRTLTRPPLAPPDWVFGPVWTTLYFLMGVALYLVWRQGTNRSGMRLALMLFAIQLVLNTCWSLVFFGTESIGGGAAVIVVLWLSIAATTVAFYRISQAAALLLAPYLLWVSFATYLNFGFLALN